MSQQADRNLLVGILALQLDFVTRDQLIAAMHAWILEKTTPLDHILRSQSALREDAHALLNALVAKHLEMHGGDPQQSLAAVSSVASLHQELRRLADPDVDASLAAVARREGNVPAPKATSDPDFTIPFQIGGAGSGRRFRIL